MSSRSLRWSPVRARATVRVYGSLFLLLLTSALAQLAITGGVTAVSDRLETTLDPQLVGAVVYAALGLGALSAVYAVYRLRSGDSLGPDDLFTLGGVSGLLLLVVAYRLHGSMELPVFPGDIVTALLTGAVAMGLVALVYASARKIDVSFDAPDHDDLPFVGGGVLTAALAGIVPIAVLVANPPLFIYLIHSGQSGPSLSALFLNTVGPELFVGIGMGVLYGGVVYGALREPAGPTSAVAAIAALVGVNTLVTPVLFRNTDTVAVAVTTAGIVFVSLFVAFLAAQGCQLLQQSLDIEHTPIVGAVVGGLFVLFGLGGVFVTMGTAPPVYIANVLGFTVVAAVGATGYERTRSVWVPAAAFAAYLILVDADLALFLVRSFVNPL